MSGLMYLAGRLVLAVTLANSPGSAAAETECDRHWTREGDGWWECTVALETWRCEVQGWCDPCETAPYQACELPDPVRPGQSYVTDGTTRLRAGGWPL